MKMRYTTPLRYPGGKSKLSNFMKLVFMENDLVDGHYVETYAGGAGVAFSLLFEEYASNIHINDLNKSIYCFWRSVLEQPEELCQLIFDTPVNMESWHYQKTVQNNPEGFSSLQLGYSTFFLNRTNMSGIIKGGVIGGKEQLGRWQIDARFNKRELVERIRKIAGYRQRIHVYNLDAQDFIKGIIPALPKNTLVYFDPPYYVKGQRLYENHYLHGDHADVAKQIKRVKQKWIVSYDNVTEIRDLYKDLPQQLYRLNYSASDRYEGSEVMIFCKSLEVPQISNPTRVPTKHLSRQLELAV